MDTIFNLGDGIGGHLTYRNPIAVGSEIYRFIFEIYSDPRKPHFLLKEYEVWVSKTFVEDFMNLTHEPTEEEMFGFARDYLISRYKLSGNNVPVENGVYLTNQTGEIRGDPRTFSLNTRDNKRLIRTTIMLPPATLEWLKKYKKEKGVDMGEAIRRAVNAFQINKTCRCTSQNHSHSIPCDMGAIEEDGYCKECHDKAGDEAIKAIEGAPKHELPPR